MFGRVPDLFLFKLYIAYPDLQVLSFLVINIFFFCSIDTGDDGRISKEEFCNKKMKDMIEVWVGDIPDMEAEFNKIDTNGGGQILFTEFVLWALSKNLDLDDDDSSDEDD